METEKTINTFRNWELFEELPDGWKIDKSCGSPLHGFEFCTNGISILRGGKRALVRVVKKKVPTFKKIQPVAELKKVNQIQSNEEYVFPSKSVNELARKKFQEHMLKDISFDLMVCKIDGYDKREYIAELKNLINSIDLS